MCLPILGRFLQVDPIEGGGDNAYVYVNDPVNHNDLDGMVPPIVVGVAWHLGRVAVQHAIRHAVKHSAKHAVKHVTKRVATNAAKKRVQWSAGKFHNAGRNAAYHYNKHARKIGARSQKAYNRSARNTVRRHIDYHRYRNGRVAYLDKRGRIIIVNRRGNYVSHFKPKKAHYWYRNIKRGR